jgi:hypothetical protein
MPTSKERHDFIDAVKVAVHSSCAAIRAAHPGESLAGFALATDDGLETLSDFFVTREGLAASANTDFLFAPTDWPEGLDPDPFDALSEQLRSWSDVATDFHAHVNDSFAVLVEALAETKREGLFEDHVFLSVLSTDPSRHLRGLERSSVRLLNVASIVKDREAFLARWQ